MKKLFTLAIACITITAASAQLIKNDFLTGYKVGDDLEDGTYENTTQGEGTPIMENQWNLSGKKDDNNTQGANPFLVSPLVYPGYAESGKDVAIDLLKLDKGGRTSIYSLANNNTYGEGTYYIAFMSTVSLAGDASEFFSLDGNYTGNAQRARYSIKGNEDETTYQIGINGNTQAADIVYIPNKSFNYNQTYLCVMKVVLNGSGGGDVSLFINPDLSAEPATPDVSTNLQGTALKSIRGFVVRQRATLAAQIGGFRFAKTWKDAIGDSSSNISGNTTFANSIHTSGNRILTETSGLLKVIDLSGAEVINQQTSGELNTGLSKGLYIAQFIDNAGNTTTQKIVIR